MENPQATDSRKMVSQSRKLLGALLLMWLCTDLIASGIDLPKVLSEQKLEDFPSSHWPRIVVPTQDITVKNESADLTIPKGYRGTLQRCEGNQLIVDFGRKGIHTIEHTETDFMTNMIRSLQGEQIKEYPNLTMQIGTKLIQFVDRNKPEHIELETIEDTKLYLFIYLDDYEEDLQTDLFLLGEDYRDLRKEYPEILAVMLPRDETYYDFGYTIGLPIPYLSRHMRTGYLKSLQHPVARNSNYIVLTDAEGKLLYHYRVADSGHNPFAQAADAALRSVGIKHYFQSLHPSPKPRSRSASWINN